MLGSGFAAGVAVCVVGAGALDPCEDDCACAIAAVPTISTAIGKALHFNQVSFISLSCTLRFYSDSGCPGHWVIPKRREKVVVCTTGRRFSFFALEKVFRYSLSTTYGVQNRVARVFYSSDPAPCALNS